MRDIYEALDSDLKIKSDPKPAKNAPNQVQFYILNYSTSNFKEKYLCQYKMDKIRINFAPHAYLLPQSKDGDQMKFNIYAALYT